MVKFCQNKDKYNNLYRKRKTNNKRSKNNRYRKDRYCMKKSKKYIVILIATIAVFAICTAVIASSKKYIYNKEIESIVIEYYEGCDIVSGEESNGLISLNTINLKTNDFEDISKLTKSLSKDNFLKFIEMYKNIKSSIIVPHIYYYKLKVNDSFTIYIGKEYGIVEGKDIYFNVPKELYNKLSEVTKKYSEQNLYKKINCKSLTIIKENEKLEITDKEQLNNLSNYQYYVINGEDKRFKGEIIAYTLDLIDGRKIDIYLANTISCIYYKNGTHEYIYTGNLEDYIETIFKNSRVKMNGDNINEITVTYKNNKYIIDNQDKILELLRNFKSFEHNDSYFLKYMSENDFNDDDIKIYIGKSKYIIPGNRNWGSRFYIDEDGKMYDVDGLFGSEVENFFKDLVGYSE